MHHVLPGAASALEVPLARKFEGTTGLGGAFEFSHGAPERVPGIDLNAGPVHLLTLNSAAASVAITLAGAVDGGRYTIVLQVTLDGVSRATTWPSNVLWSSDGPPPTLSTVGDATNAYVWIEMIYIGSRNTWLGRWAAHDDGEAL